MTTLASRLERPSPAPEAAAAPAPWLPPEAPLAMPRQSLDEADAPELAQTMPATSPRGVAHRRLAVFGGALFLTILIAIGPYALYARAGFNGLETVGLGVFIVLCGAIATWFCTAAAMPVARVITCPPSESLILRGMSSDASW